MLLYERKLLLLLITSVLIAIAASAYAVTYPLTVKDCRGRAVTIAREPAHIVSTVPSNTEILFALGLDSRIVGVGAWDDYPAQAKRKTKVGDRYISLEKVISLKPDVVVAHGRLNADIIPSLEKYGIPVIAIDPQTIEQVSRDILLIGKVTNRERQAQEVSAHIVETSALVKKISSC